MGASALDSTDSDSEKTTVTRSQNGDGVWETPQGCRTSYPPPNDPFLVAWDCGDKDPMNPRSMSKARKWVAVIVVSLASFCVTAASSIYTSTYEKMEASFGNSRTASVLGLSVFVLGIACGPLCFGPLSELYGRRPIYLVAWSMYLIWTVPQAVARNVATIIVGRFFCGFSGSTFLAVSGGTVGDLFSKDDLQYPMAIFTVAPAIGPCIGPLMGGYINYHFDWRWTYYVLLMWASALLVAIVLLVPETFHPIVLSQKARHLRNTTGESRWKAPIETTDKSVLQSIVLSLSRPFQLLFFEPMCLALCIFTAILLGILYLFFGAFPLMFRTLYGFNLWQVGMTFLGIGVGLIIGVLTDTIWIRIRLHLMSKCHMEEGKEDGSEPEFRLPPAMAGAIIVPVGLFIFAWTAFPSIHWVVPIVGSAVFGIGNLLVFNGIFTFLVDAYPDYAASALAANAFVRGVFAAAFPLFGNQMYESLGFQWASSLLAFLTLAMMPFPYLFFKYGKRIRAGSRFAHL
ncbi:major facilitator superfamily domain-containing protein [Dactylonectria macrodidyma]|uniref:Major facilitator superfamily domain-containing protein n=1 Tax=Dactylonectria macrodidyma TaxID=307937 RepID=A0A9P9IFZ6_9HYPO|nr:major facilitator superfamily domain-containing protein [Dactylonectria macrodidyma]